MNSRWNGTLPFNGGSYIYRIEACANDSSARSAGRNAKLAEEVLYNDRETIIGHYSSDLEELLEIDRNLTDDPYVTFMFMSANQTGFTLWTTHYLGTGAHFTYTE